MKNIVFAQLLRLSKHSIIYGLGAAASQIISFFLLPMYTRYLSPSDYGVLEVFNATAWVLYVFAILGLGIALLRFYIEHDNDEAKKEILNTVFLFLTGTSFIIALVAIIFAGQLSNLVFHSSLYTTHFRVLFLTMFFDVSVNVVMTVFRAQQKSISYVAVTIARLVMATGLNIYFLVVLHKGILGVLEAALITVFVLYIVLVFSIRKDIKFKFSIPKLKQMLLFGLPFVPSDISDWVLSLADRYFLQFLSTSQELGLYALGYKFGAILGSLLIGPFALVWQPFVASIAKNDNARRIYASVFTYFLLLGTCIFLGLSLLSKEVIVLMTTSPFYDAYKIVPLIASAYLLKGCYVVFEGGLFLEKKTKYIPVVMGIATAINLGLNYLLDSKYGMFGAAAATAISYAVMPAIMFFISRKFYTVPYEFGRIVKILIAAVPIFVGGMLITNHSRIIEGLFRIAILVMYPVLLYLLRFFTTQEITKTKEIIANTFARVTGRGTKR